MKPGLVATSLLTVCGIVQAASPPEQAASPAEQAALPDQEQAARPKKKEMNPKEPMKVPMAKEGMMMGDVKESAAKKDAAMKEMMQQEQMKMPAAPK